ncbi:NAD(P)-binding protein, partial [Aureobasidium melanogenum]|uniref:NAD(P)-binding protein n=1 Tax=Aureobasidium melanogenum (strain CBS 110374) TaxID=1043003 RepID=A0A074VTD0_AURM1
MSWSTPNDYKSRPVVVLGGGVLGRRIAACWVAAGWHVRVRDPSEKSRNDAVSYVEENINTYLALTKGTKGQCVAVADLEEAVKDAWLIFEAVPEILALKEDTFADLEKLAPADCILASNSSSYKCSELLAKVSQSTKERVLNTHYMMPPQALIVELMTSGYTNSEIFPLLEVELTKAGLHPYTAKKESTGFIFNRIWAAIKREVMAVIEEGVADPKTIDDIWKEQYQSPVGPCTMMDSVGLDTVHHIESHYVHDRGLPDKTLDWLQKNYLDQGKLGNKCDKGGLYPPHTELHGTKLAILNMNLGAYPGELGNKLLSSGQVLTLPVDQKAAKPIAIVHDQKLPDGIDVHGDRLYWTCMGSPNVNDGAVFSAKLDGSDVQTVIAPGKVHTPKQLYIDQESQKLYFCDREGLRVHRSNLDGSEHEILVQTGDWETEKDKVADQRNWPVGITVSKKLNRLFWTQKGSPKSNQGRILSAGLESPSDPSARNDIEIVMQGLPEPIDLEFDDEEGVLYWTDRGELPLGNTLNRKTLTGPVPATEKTFGRQLIAQGFGEAIGLRLNKKKQCIYVADLAGRIWQCGTGPGPKTKIYEAGGHAYTGIAIINY